MAASCFNAQITGSLISEEAGPGVHTGETEPATNGAAGDSAGMESGGVGRGEGGGKENGGFSAAASVGDMECTGPRANTGSAGRLLGGPGGAGPWEGQVNSLAGENEGGAASGSTGSTQAVDHSDPQRLLTCLNWPDGWFDGLSSRRCDRDRGGGPSIAQRPGDCLRDAVP